MHSIGHWVDTSDTKTQKQRKQHQSNVIYVKLRSAHKAHWTFSPFWISRNHQSKHLATPFQQTLQKPMFIWSQKYNTMHCDADSPPVVLPSEWIRLFVCCLFRFVCKADDILMSWFMHTFTSLLASIVLFIVPFDLRRATEYSISRILWLDGSVHSVYVCMSRSL